MALTDDQVAFYQSKLGTGVDLTDVELRLARLDDPFKVVLEVLEVRYANLLAAPTSFSVPGEYSQDTRGQLTALQAAIRAAQSDLTAEADVVDGAVTLQEPYYALPVRQALDTEEFFARYHGRRGLGR